MSVSCQEFFEAAGGVWLEAYSAVAACRLAVRSRIVKVHFRSAR
jgi:hypothetical protein